MNLKNLSLASLFAILSLGALTAPRRDERLPALDKTSARPADFRWTVGHAPGASGRGDHTGSRGAVPDVQLPVFAGIALQRLLPD